jgi:hypothetical protein
MNLLMQVSLFLTASISTPGAWGGRVGRITVGVFLALGFGLGVLVGVAVARVRVGCSVRVGTAVRVGFGVFDGTAALRVGEGVDDALAVSCAVFAGPGVDTDFLTQPIITTSKTKVLNSANNAWRVMTFAPVRCAGTLQQERQLPALVSDPRVARCGKGTWLQGIEPASHLADTWLAPPLHGQGKQAGKRQSLV